jgi:hypothetical protein
LRPSYTTNLGERAAADIVRKQLPDVEDAQRRLSTTGFAPGAAPSSAQLVPELGGLAAQKEMRDAMALQQSGAAQSFGEQVSRLADQLPMPAPSFAEALNIPLDANPMGVSSRQARQAFDAAQHDRRHPDS